MRAKRVTKFGFECPVCNAIHAHDEKLETSDAWRVNEVSDGADDLHYTLEEPQTAQVYLYDKDNDNDCIGEDEPTYQEVWRCGECETDYLDKDEAKACCRS